MKTTELDRFEFPRIDLWLRRGAVAAMVAVALGLVGLGIALYAPRAGATGLEDDVSVTKASLGSR
jgi:hypothetical protein